MRPAPIQQPRPTSSKHTSSYTTKNRGSRATGAASKYLQVTFAAINVATAANDYCTYRNTLLKTTMPKTTLKTTPPTPPTLSLMKMIVQPCSCRSRKQSCSQVRHWMKMCLCHLASNCESSALKTTLKHKFRGTLKTGSLQTGSLQTGSLQTGSSQAGSLQTGSL